MGIKVDFKDAMADARKQAERLEQAMFNRMVQAGEKFVTNARLDIKIDTGAFPSQHKGKTKGAFTDQSKNLRNSIGYVIYRNGVSVKENFEGSGEGEAAAKSELANIPKPSGYLFIGIAGMNYASYVESLGYNVITSQSLIFMMDLEKGLKKLSKKTGSDFSLNSMGRSSSL